MGGEYIRKGCSTLDSLMLASEGGVTKWTAAEATAARPAEEELAGSNAEDVVAALEAELVGSDAELAALEAELAGGALSAEAGAAKRARLA